VGVRWVGAGVELAAARAPVRVSTAGARIRGPTVGADLSVVAFSDHPAEFAAEPGRAGIAFADVRGEVPEWLLDTIARAAADGPVLVSGHWGPNMTSEPLQYVRRAAARLRDGGAALIAGHSAHVFHGAAPGVLFDLGDFVDDYVVDRSLRNDLGLLFLVTLTGGRAETVEAVPLKLDYCHTRLAGGEEAEWVRRRFRAACAALGTEARESGGRVVVQLEQG
jgi:poly-gamma-glutamate synthesis protein (capsule biosynthesis protein)